MNVHPTDSPPDTPSTCDHQAARGGTGLSGGERERTGGGEDYGREATSPIPLSSRNSPQNRLGRDAQALSGTARQNGVDMVNEIKLTVPKAAKAMGIGQNKMREIITSGEIYVLRIRGKMLLLERDIEAYLLGRYGPMKVVETKPFGKLPPLPKEIAESEMLKKASCHNQ